MDRSSSCPPPPRRDERREAMSSLCCRHRWDSAQARALFLGSPRKERDVVEILIPYTSHSSSRFYPGFTYLLIILFLCSTALPCGTPHYFWSPFPAESSSDIPKSLSSHYVLPHPEKWDDLIRFTSGLCLCITLTTCPLNRGRGDSTPLPYISWFLHQQARSAFNESPTIVPRTTTLSSPNSVQRPQPHSTPIRLFSSLLPQMLPSGTEVSTPDPLLIHGTTSAAVPFPSDIPLE